MSLGYNIKLTIEKPSNIGNGNTLYVGGSGEGNYSKIQDAIDNASSGDTVFVFDDSSPYNEVIRIDKTITLIGENRETTIINGKNIGDVIIITASNVKITGFTIQNNSGNHLNYSNGILMRSNYSNISGNTIYNNNIALLMQDSNNNTIQNNIFSDNIANAITIEYSNYNNFKDNIISNFGIEVYKSNRNSFNNNSIPKGNLFLHMEANDNNIIGNNVLGIVISDDSDNNMISSNIVLYDAYYGISISDNSNSNTISSNTISNKQYGIKIDSSRYNLIIDNKISNNYYGILIGDNGGAYHNTIKSNDISNNEYGVKIESQFISGSTENLISKNNLNYNKINALDSKPLFHFFLGGKNKWDNNYYSNYKGGRVHFIPVFLILYYVIPIPFFTIDWNPASEPYDILIIK